MPESKVGKLIYQENFESGFTPGFNFYRGTWNIIDDNTGNKVLSRI